MHWVFFCYKTKRIDRHYHSFLVEKSSKFHLERLTEDSQWIGKQHSLVTQSLHDIIYGCLAILSIQTYTYKRNE